METQVVSVLAMDTEELNDWVESNFASFKNQDRRAVMTMLFLIDQLQGFVTDNPLRMAAYESYLDREESLTEVKH